MAEPSRIGIPVQLRPLHGDVAGVVARRRLLLERGLVLLVDHDQAEPPRRREHGRAGADDHLRPRPRRCVCQCRCRSASLRWLCSTATWAKRRRNRRIVCGVRLISGTSTIASRPRATTCSIALRVDLRLAAAGHAVDQERREAVAGRGQGRVRRAPPAARRSAGGCARAASTVIRAVGIAAVGERDYQPRPESAPDRVDDAAPPQGRDRPAGAVGHPADVGDRERLGRAAEDRQRLGLLGGQRRAWS